jgi:hypothetical protein
VATETVTRSNTVADFIQHAAQHVADLKDSMKTISPPEVEIPYAAIR